MIWVEAKNVSCKISESKISNEYTYIDTKFYMYSDCVVHYQRIVRKCCLYLRTHVDKVLAFTSIVSELCYHFMDICLS